MSGSPDIVDKRPTRQQPGWVAPSRRMRGYDSCGPWFETRAAPAPHHEEEFGFLTVPENAKHLT